MFFVLFCFLNGACLSGICKMVLNGQWPLLECAGSLNSTDETLRSWLWYLAYLLNQSVSGSQVGKDVGGLGEVVVLFFCFLLCFVFCLFGFVFLCSIGYGPFPRIVSV